MIQAKKSLGQNFLVDRNILEKIVNITQIKDKTILEVGPGTGNLTSFILKKKPRKIFVVEKDEDLANHLEETFKNQLTIINDDILKINESSLFESKVTVFGNLPYNISTEILSKWIANSTKDLWFNNLILMFQKEVADRIIAKFDTSNYGRLSIISNWKLNVEKICDIKPECFSPKPKVDSSLLFFSPKKKFTKFNNPKNLEKITRVFFNHRRKMIKKPFNKMFPKKEELLDKLQISLNLRPHNLDFETYYNLTSEFEKLQS